MSDMYVNLLLLLCVWNVSINAFPENELERVTVQEDGMVNLVCSITKEDLPSAIIWRKADSTTPLTIGEHVYVDNKRIRVHKVEGTETQTWYFTIHDASLSDQGIYLCEITSREQRVLKQYSLEVTPNRGRPGPIGINLTGTEHVKQNDTIHLVCTAAGGFEPPEDIHWYDKENEIMAKDRVTITKRQDLSRRSTTSVLEISHSRLNDSDESSSEATTPTQISDNSSQPTKATLTCGQTLCDTTGRFYCCSDKDDQSMDCCCSGNIYPYPKYCNHDCYFPWYGVIIIISVGFVIVVATVISFKLYHA